jgi:hypothetical protein
MNGSHQQATGAIPLHAIVRGPNLMQQEAEMNCKPWQGLAGRPAIFGSDGQSTSRMKNLGGGGL